MREPVNWKRVVVILEEGFSESRGRERCLPARGTGTEQNTCANNMGKLTCVNGEAFVQRMIDVDGREWSCGSPLCKRGMAIRISCWGTVTLADVSAQLVVAA